MSCGWKVFSIVFSIIFLIDFENLFVFLICIYKDVKFFRFIFVFDWNIWFRLLENLGYCRGKFGRRVF